MIQFGSAPEAAGLRTKALWMFLFVVGDLDSNIHGSSSEVRDIQKTHLLYCGFPNDVEVLRSAACANQVLGLFVCENAKSRIGRIIKGAVTTVLTDALKIGGRVGEVLGKFHNVLQCQEYALLP